MMIQLTALARRIDYNFFRCQEGDWLLEGWEEAAADLDVTGPTYGDVKYSTCRVVSRSLIRELGPCVLVNEDVMRSALWDAIQAAQDELYQLVDLLDEQLGGEVELRHYGSRVVTDAAAKRKTTSGADAYTDTTTHGARTDTVTGTETYTYPPTNAGLVEPATRNVNESGQYIDTLAGGARASTVEEDPHTDTHTEVAHDDRTERILTPSERSKIISEYANSVYGVLRNALLLAINEGRHGWGL